jgi:hypothetical protein
MPLSVLKDMFRSMGASGPEVEPEGDPVHLATAAILLELAHADQHLSEREEAQMVDALKETFGLTEELARKIIDESRGRTIELADPAEHRSGWRSSDLVLELHEYEEYLVRKLATFRPAPRDDRQPNGARVRTSVVF